MSTHAMIDLETAGLSVDTIILSIGIVKFYPAVSKIDDGIELFPDIDEQNFVRRTVEGGTLKWWLGQSEEARNNIIQGSNERMC